MLRYLEAPESKNKAHLVVLHRLRREAISRYATPRDFKTIRAQARPQSLKHKHTEVHCRVTLSRLKHVVDDA